MKTHQWVGGISWILVGILVSIHAYQLGLGHYWQPGPGFIFFWAGLLLIIFGSVDLGQMWIQMPRAGTKQESIWSGTLWPKVLLVLISMSAYVYFLEILGFYASTFILMIFLFKGVETNTKWWIAIAGAVVTLLVSFGVFEVWLQVPLPKGFLGF